MARKRRRETAPAVPRDMPAEQIGWVTEVTVHSVSPDQVVLGRPGVRATVRKNGSFDLNFLSDSLAPSFMMRDVSRTYDLQNRFFGSGSDEEWLEKLRHWAEPPPILSFRGGRAVAEWPGTGESPPRRLGELGLVPDTAGWNAPFFQGSRFRFAHFKTKEGEEGAVIQWHDPRTDTFDPPIVYLGDFARFIETQTRFDPETPEEWLEFNELFDNTFMWALEKMGSFDEPWTLRPEAVEAVVEDPEILLTESVAKMLPRLEEYRTQAFREAVRDAAEARGLA